MSSHVAIDTLSWLIEMAFDKDSDQSLMANLRNVRDEDWNSLPAGAHRSIADILEHAGWCKWMYEDYAFGTGTLRGDLPPQIPPEGARARPRKELLEWLLEGHRKWHTSIRALPNDSDLDRDRMTNWGELMPTRQILRIMIGHDYYHAGEINHLRSLLQGTDHWPYD